MKPALVTVANKHYQPITDVTWARMEEWCNRFGVVFMSKIHGWRTGAEASWAKLEAALEASKAGHDRIIVLDADVLLIDLDYGFERLESYLADRHKLAFSYDLNGLCAGAFLARGGVWFEKFVDALSFLGPTNRKPLKHEQDAIKVLLENFPTVFSVAGGIPQTVIASKDTELTERKPWAYHLWAGDWPDLDKLREAMLKALCQPWEQKLAGTLRPPQR